MRAAASLELHPTGVAAQVWEQLQLQAQSLARLAGLAPESNQVGADAFSQLLENAACWQRDLARDALTDMDAMVKPGIAALNMLSDRGQDTTAPALALWREYYMARGKVLNLLASQDRPDERGVD
ncbi:MAG: hypothetical protein AAF697_14315 [Pseudomonadota bacterium]